MRINTELENLEKEVSKSIEEDVRKLVRKMSGIIDRTNWYCLNLFVCAIKVDWPSDLTEELMAKAEFEIKAETRILSAGALK